MYKYMKYFCFCKAYNLINKNAKYIMGYYREKNKQKKKTIS